MNSKFGLVYLIKCLTTGQNYVGSTCAPLKKRLSTHKNSTHNCCLSRKIISNNNYKVIILEENIIEENLLDREQSWMDQTENLVNIRRAKPLYYETDEERLSANATRGCSRREWARNFGDPIDNCVRTNSNNLLLIKMDLFD